MKRDQPLHLITDAAQSQDVQKGRSRAVSIHVSIPIPVKDNDCLLCTMLPRWLQDTSQVWTNGPAAQAGKCAYDLIANDPLEDRRSFSGPQRLDTPTAQCDEVP